MGEFAQLPFAARLEDSVGGNGANAWDVQKLGAGGCVDFDGRMEQVAICPNALGVSIKR
jgi:hypothetical protein